MAGRQRWQMDKGYWCGVVKRTLQQETASRTELRVKWGFVSWTGLQSNGW